LAARTWPDPAGLADTVALVAGPDLPGAVGEVESLAGIYPTAGLITPPPRTPKTFAHPPARARVAPPPPPRRLPPGKPLFSSLLLSAGPLTVQELYARGLAPHRLIIAACESGAGIAYAGDELLGFVSALLARGTAGILASTAAVPDVAAVDLMTAVHRRLVCGATLAHALHEARESQDTDNPATFVNWCTFNAHGAA